MFEKFLEKITVTKAETEVEELIKEAVETNNSIGVYWTANAIKSKYANKCFTGYMPTDDYARIFKIGKADAYHHYLDLYLAERGFKTR